MRIRLLNLIIATAMAALIGGCASTDPDRESDMPWNMPQSWEGSPSIPGMN